MNSTRFIIKNCRLCFNEWDPEKEIGYNPKLADLCCKYLHSSLTQELSIEVDDQPFCPKCSMTGMEIFTLSEQMEFIQRSLSELVFMFSLEILHRRGKNTNAQERNEKKLMEFDVSALPNCESWNNPTPEFGTSGSSSENLQTIIPENVYIENAEDQILVPDFVDHRFSNDGSTGEMKYEIILNNSEVWNEVAPSLEEVVTNRNTPYLTDNTECLNDKELLTTSENAREISGSNTCSGLDNRLLTPNLQLKKLQIQSEGKYIIAEDDRNYLMFNNYQLGDSGKTVWTKMDPGSSFRLTQPKLETSNDDGDKQLNSHPFNLISTEAAKTTMTSEACVSTSLKPSSRKGWRDNMLAKRSDGDQSKSYKHSFFKKRFKKQTGMTTHKMGHLGEKNYQCTFCSKCFLKYAGLSFHLRQSHSVGHIFQCSCCPKGFVRKWDFIRHKRTHTGEKPFGCDQCDYTAALQSNVKDHKIRHHANVNFQCKECGYNSKTFKMAKQHYKRVHFALEFTDNVILKQII